jgi:hypothetical protein
MNEVDQRKKQPEFVTPQSQTGHDSDSGSRVASRLVSQSVLRTK